MKAFLKFLLIVLVWSLIGAVLIGGVLLLGLPLEWGVLAFVGLLLVWYGFKLLRLLWRRYLARRRVEQLVNVAPDEKGFRPGVWRLWRRRNERDERFRQILGFLRSSRLSRHGEPLRALPWFVLLGDSSADKRRMLEEARLPRPTLEHEILHSQGDDVDWHLYNQGIVLNTPASFSDAAAEGSHEDWLRLLMQLDRHRRPQAVDAAVIAVSLADLMDSDSDQQVRMAMKYRRMLEDIMQLTGVRPPVTLLLTGLEKIPGAEDWILSLDEAARASALGCQRRSGQTPAEFVHVLLQDVCDRIYRANRQALRNRRATPDLLRLPAQLGRLAHPLERLLGTLFDENRYQDTPELAGVYLSAVAPSREGSGPETQFVESLFTRYLPRQPQQVAVVETVARARRARQRWQGLAWGGVVGLALFVLTSLYLQDLKVLDDTRRDYARALSPETGLEANINNLLAYQDLVESLSGQRHLPWYLPDSEPDYLTILKTDLATRVRQQLVDEVDRIFLSRLENTYFNDASQNVVRGVEYTSVLIRRNNILTTYLAGAGVDDLMDMPQPFATDTFANNAPESLDELNELYIQSLIWAREAEPDAQEAATRSELASLRTRLDRILAHAGPELDWLTTWANQNPLLQGYRVSDFWTDGSGPVDADVQVPAAYTLAGKELIDGFIEELLDASSDEGLVNAALPRFQDNYRRDYIAAWGGFAQAFSDGNDSLRARDEWLNVINSLTTGRNLYFNALNLVDNQLQPFVDDGAETPDWVTMLGYYQDMRALGPDDGTDNSGRNKVLSKLALKVVGKAGPVGKMLAKSGKKGLKTQQKLNKASGGPSPDERAERLEEAALLLAAYEEAISGFVYSAEIRSTSYAATAELFRQPDNPAAGGSGYAKASEAIQKLQAMVGKENADNRPFWSLYKAPLDLMRGYMIEEASCEFNERWRNQVLASLEGVPAYKRPVALAGEGGLLWNFIETAADPFLKRSLGQGYVLVSAQKDRLGITSDFLEFVARSADQRRAEKEFVVNITTLPTSLNLGTSASVEQTTVIMGCPDNRYELRNRNYPASMDFAWNEDCQDVRLNIDLGVLKLERVYEGSDAFPEFLRDFQSGPRRLTPEDFPRQQSSLEVLGVQEILVQYDLNGAAAVLNYARRTPVSVPTRAAHCWAI